MVIGGEGILQSQCSWIYNLLQCFSLWYEARWSCYAGEEQVVGAEGLGGGVEEPGQKADEQEDPAVENLSDVSCPD